MASPNNSPDRRLRPSHRGHLGPYGRFSLVAYVKYAPRCASGRAPRSASRCLVSLDVLVNNPGRRMRKLLPATLVLGIVLAARPTPARADFGIGLFLGEPTGLDMKVGLGPRTGLDILLGFTSFRGRAGYGHLTYLVTSLVGNGSLVLVLLRLGIGAAVYDFGDLAFAFCASFEVGFRLRRTSLEFYGEIALLLTLVSPGADPFADVQAGVGFRVFF